MALVIVQLFTFVGTLIMIALEGKCEWKNFIQCSLEVALFITTCIVGEKGLAEFNFLTLTLTLLTGLFFSLWVFRSLKRF